VQRLTIVVAIFSIIPWQHGVDVDFCISMAGFLTG
jgi:hypothetical protein